MPYSHLPSTDPHLRGLILAALARCGLSPTLARSVEALLPRVQDDWRVCCGSGCDPCVLPLARVVDMVRAQLSPPLSGAAPPERPKSA